MTRSIRFAQVLIAVVTILGLGIFSTLPAFAHSAQRVKTPGQSPACPQLPANFDPTTASTSTLQHFHLPPPPTDATLRAAWVEELKHIKHLDCDNSFTPTNLLSQLTPAGTLVTAGDEYSQNWSGYDVVNDTFDDVKGNWNTQCLGSNQHSVSLLATWVGIGGEHGNPLWQAGTIYTNSDGLYHPWWEAWPYNGIQVDWNIAGGCGLSTKTEAYLSSNGTWCYYVNFDGFVASGCPISTNTFFADESNAEWIDERPTCSGKYSHLADFNYTSWSNTYAHSTVRGWHTLRGFASNKIHMEQNSGLFLAEPDNTSSATTFTDRYKNKDTDGVNCTI